MSQKTLAYPERETALILAAVMSVSVYDAAISAGLLAEHITQPPLAAIWTAVAALRDSGKEVRGALLMERLRTARMDEACKPLVLRAALAFLPGDLPALFRLSAVRRCRGQLPAQRRAIMVAGSANHRRDEVGVLGWRPAHLVGRQRFGRAHLQKAVVC